MAAPTTGTYEKWAKVFGASHTYLDNIPIYFGNEQDASLQWDGDSLNLSGDVEISGDVSLGTEDISLVQGHYIYFDGQGGGEYIRSASADTLIVNATTTLYLAIGGTAEVSLTASSLSPFASGGSALGTTTYMWNGLCLAASTAINWNNSNMTITHSTGVLTVAGGTTAYSDTTDSTSGTTGAINTLGGLGVTKAAYVGTNLVIGSGDIDLSAASTGVYDLILKASQSDALSIKFSSTDMMVFDTSTPKITFTPALDITGVVTHVGAVYLSPNAIGTMLDFVLETEWVSGTLINADFASATTLTNDVIGMLMDFNTQVTMTTDKDVKVYQIKLPALSQTAANSTVITGIDIPTAGALVQSSGAGTITWSGVNIQLPNTTQTTGTVNSHGLYITPGTVTSGTQYGIYMAGAKAYLPLQVGTKANTAGSGFIISSAAADNSGGVQLYADDNGAAVASPMEVITPFRSRYLLTVGQSGGVSQTALFAQLRTLGDTGTPLILNTGAWRSAYIFNQLGGTTIQGGAEVLGINQATTLAGNMIVTSGTFAGVDVNISGTGTISNSGTCAAVLIRSSGTPVWTNGIQIKNSGAVTGILIGTGCTTAIQTGQGKLIFDHSTGAAASNTTCYLTTSVTGNQTGSCVGFRSIVAADGTARSFGNVYGIMGAVRLSNASDTVAGGAAAVLAQLDLGSCTSTVNGCAIQCDINPIPAGVTAAQVRGFMVFQDWGKASSFPVNVLFDVGGYGNYASTGDGVSDKTKLIITGGHASTNIQLKTGLRCLVNNAVYYLPLIATGDWQDDGA